MDDHHSESSASKRKRCDVEGAPAASLEGKVIVVTGAGMSCAEGDKTHGIGSATALALVRAGASVWAIDRERLRAERTVEAAAEEGHSNKCHACPCNVTESNDVLHALEECAARLGRIDGLVNVVGVTQPGGILEVTTEQWRRTMDVNVTSMFLCIKHALPHMLERGCGSIVNVGSVSGVRAVRPEVAYAASKGAVNSLTMSVAMEFADRGIRCNAVLPGLIKTPLVSAMLRQKAASSGQTLGEQELASALAARDAASPTGRMGEPGHCASLIAFLMSDASAYVNGTEIPVDGGLCMRAAV